MNHHPRILTSRELSRRSVSFPATGDDRTLSSAGSGSPLESAVRGPNPASAAASHRLFIYNAARNRTRRTVTGGELRSVVARRGGILDCLSERRLTKPELVDVADASRSTIDRAIDDLREHGLVEREGSQYAATVTGELMLGEFREYSRRLADLERAEPVLSALPGGVDVDPAILRDADVHVTKPFAPEYPIRRSVEIVERADRMRGYGPVVLPQYVDVLRAAIIENDLELELVFTPAVIDLLADAHEELRQLFAADNTTVYRTDEGPFYALWQAETPEGTHSGLVSCTDEGVKGAVVNDTDAMNEWACATYGGYRRDAEVVETVCPPTEPRVEGDDSEDAVSADAAAQSNSPVDM